MRRLLAALVMACLMSVPAGAAAAPGPPLGLSTVGGDAWRAANGFRFEWLNPEGQQPPIVGAYYLITRVDGEAVEGPTFVPGIDIESVGPIAVPEPDAYLAWVWLVDQGGGVGPARGTGFRFDDLRPADVRPTPPSGWVSEDEFPLRLDIPAPTPTGPSGIAGYAFTVSARSGQFPCAFAICTPSEIDLGDGVDNRTIELENLPEGRSWVSAVAVSGSRLSSQAPGSVPVDVDKVPPVTALDPVPPGWTAGPVRLAVAAQDSRSGMQARPATDDGSPRVWLAVDGEVRATRLGSRVEATVQEEGVHRVTHWAEDLAGNVGDPEQATPATVRIDRTGPSIELLEEAPVGDPELLRARVSDALSGVASGAILIRPAGSQGAYSSLPSGIQDGAIVARVPSEDIAQGEYEVAARASDAAGNITFRTTTKAGAPLVVSAPMKERTSLEVKLPRGRPALTVGYGGRPPLEGSLLAAGGRPVAGAEVTVTERLGPGSQLPLRQRQIVTDERGSFRLRLAPGPSRTVSVAFRGDRRLTRAVSPELFVRSKGRIQFDVASDFVYNGQSARMSGRIGARGARIPGRGKLVAIQYFDPARKRWRPVEVLRTDRRGRFEYAYRFRTIGYAQRILFRAVSLEEAGWPYLKASSPRRSVVVYPRAP